MRALVAAIIVVGCTPTVNVTAGSASTATSTGEDPTGSSGGTAEPTSSASTGATTESPPDLPPPCPVGSEGCPCTGGGACDAGLICEASVCAPGCAVGSLGCPCTQGGGCDAGLSCSAGECVEGISPPCILGDIAMDDCCGDKILDDFEECDAGHYLNKDDSACTASCKIAKCGDGLVLEPSEACDGGDHCTAECTFKTCGDGVRDPWEWCDPVRSSPDCTDICTDARKVIFITSTHYKGSDLGGIVGANAKCQEHADAVGLDGEFRAWLTSSPDDAPETTWDWYHGPYVRVDGLLLLTFTGYFEGDLCAGGGILDEMGAAHSGNDVPFLDSMTWMWFLGSWSDELQTCNGWTGGMFGFAITWDSCTGDPIGAPCSATAPIVCVEQ